MRSRHLAAAVISFVAACDAPTETSSVEQPVVGAQIDTGDPAVVALVFSNNGVFCTGTLISPRVILTAAHCIDDAGADPNFAASFGGDTENGNARIGIDLGLQHPMWTGALGGGHDIGVLRLAAARDPLDPVPLNTTDLSTMIGADYRVVGFGINDRDTQDLDGKKRTAVMSILRVGAGTLHETFLEADDAETAICQGDSGGPGFVTVDDVEYLAGVHSYSITGCFNPSGDTNVQMFVEDFVMPWVQDNDPTCGADGTCAPIGCVDDPDCEPCGADGTCTDGCALPDPDCATAGIGEICQADTQCISGECIYWLDDPHSQFCTQPCGDDGDCPDGMSCQDTSTFGRVCYPVDEPDGAAGQACSEATDCSEYTCLEGVCTYECDLSRGLLCTEGFECASHGEGYYCWKLPVEDGGCNAGGGGLGLGALLLVLYAVCSPVMRIGFSAGRS
jgi:hypothetical protein